MNDTKRNAIMEEAYIALIYKKGNNGGKIQSSRPISVHPTEGGKTTEKETDI